jgi:VWFA-related protein
VPQAPQQPTFRVQTELVQVDVIATDAKGEFVADLKRDDFEVLEDGKAQAIAAFQLVTIPIAGSRASDAATFALSDVRNNSDSFSGRVYVLLMDDEHTRIDKSMYARQQAKRFVERYFEPGDLGAIVYTSGRRNASQEFTTDGRLLAASIDGFMGKIADPMSQADPALPGGLQQAREQTRTRGAATTLQALAKSWAASRGGARRASTSARASRSAGGRAAPSR